MPLSRCQRPHPHLPGPLATLIATAAALAASANAAAPSVHVSVWLPYWSMPAALESTIAGASVIRQASPVWYTIAGDATIEDEPGSGDPSVLSRLTARGITIVPTVTESDGLAAFDRTLASPSRRQAMVAALVEIARNPAYAGLDLDFEQFAVDRHDNAETETEADAAAAAYPTLVAQACRALHAIGRTCFVTVMPRTSAAHVIWRHKLATWVYDYTALAAAADRIQVMAYDEHAPNTPAGPLSGWPWLQRVASYARASAPLSRAELALPAYGYDFADGTATAIAVNQARALAAEHGVTPAWDATQKEETFSYTAAGRTHTVWYENSAADLDRVRLAAADGFAGTDLWAAGDEDPALWNGLRRIVSR